MKDTEVCKQKILSFLKLNVWPNGWKESKNFKNTVLWQPKRGRDCSSCLDVKHKATEHLSIFRKGYLNPPEKEKKICKIMSMGSLIIKKIMITLLHFPYLLIWPWLWPLWILSSTGTKVCKQIQSLSLIFSPAVSKKRFSRISAKLTSSSQKEN